ncbi:hypothetical protein G3480_15605 [Thiorhodococcus mannitoliphagus]|uniref:Uncharacterized protein n=1 Tax=Thiorhodococcus mannitoliphagus TaxID=329406 RepID=A0A6P1DVI3_9GAMM|nr:hypothetical protein [Thiorhodococcus mannitoliphagus]NEX21719.1 hypothetical protein [Thiorhodococcus mannitoliphagus]
MLTEINTPKDNRIVFAFPPDSGELAGQRYHLGLRFCDNPACRCGVIHVGLSPESSDLGADSDQAEPLPPSVEFGIDVHRRELDAQGSRQRGVKQQLGTAFVGALSTEDWTSLRRIFYAYKRKVTDETPDDEIEATFDADDIERASTMVSLQEVLPYAERKVVDIEGRRF